MRWIVAIGPIRIAIGLATGREPHDVAFPAPAEAIEMEVDPLTASAAGTRGALRR